MEFIQENYKKRDLIKRSNKLIKAHQEIDLFSETISITPISLKDNKYNVCEIIGSTLSKRNKVYDIA
jgi:hypothetical protein